MQSLRKNINTIKQQLYQHDSENKGLIEPKAIKSIIGKIIGNYDITSMDEIISRYRNQTGFIRYGEFLLEFEQVNSLTVQNLGEDIECVPEAFLTMQQFECIFEKKVSR